MKVLHLHIGSQKTGSTSIQMTFHQNRDELKDQGFMFPGNTQNDHLFYFATKGEQEDWPRQFKSMGQDKLQKYLDSYSASLQEGFESGIKHQIISTEYLFLHNRQYIDNVISFLDDYFDKIKVYAFIRSPIDYYRSYQQQKIKARSFIKAPNCFKYSFKEVIKSWREVADIENIPYQPGINSCKVFCDKLGVDFSRLNISDRNSNASISVEQMLLLEKIQSDLYQEHEDIYKDHLTIIQRIRAPYLNKPKLQEWVKPAVYKNHLEDLHWLKDEYDIDLLNEELEKKEITSLPTFENGKATVRDVYNVPSEESVEKYEVLVVDAILKKLVQDN